MKLTDQATEAVKWWRKLQPSTPQSDPARKHGGDRGALARLRRCSQPLEAATEPAALALARQVGIQSGSDPRLADALVAAVVLAHVRSEEKDHMARRLGPAAPGERARMSPLRLARLMAADSPDERLIAFRRAVALTGNPPTANVHDLALALLDWSQARRIEWAFRYHNTPAPGNDEAPQADPQTMDAGARA